MDPSHAKTGDLFRLIAIGLLFVIALCEVVSVIQEPAPPTALTPTSSAPSLSVESTHRLEQRLDRMVNSLERIAARYDQVDAPARARHDSVVVDPEQDTPLEDPTPDVGTHVLREALEAYSAGTEEAREKAKKDWPCAAWVNVVDSRLAKGLIVCGKTPFDPGVPPLLRHATEELDRISREVKERLKELRFLENERRKTAGKDRKLRQEIEDWFRPKSDVIYADQRSQRDAVVTQFRDALLGLR